VFSVKTDTNKDKRKKASSIEKAFSFIKVDLA